MMNYREAWAFLDNLQVFKIKLGLDSMNLFLDDLGRPQEGIRFVHVGGTNGKGSVCVSLLTILSRAGYRVGLFTSPHLNSVRERFRINDSCISEQDFARIADSIRSILNGRLITYFEFTTALAMLWFAEKRLDLAIMEVGMGGRLDATNVIQPLASVITNVSMDHEAHLGSTLSAIAFEKAGIIKHNAPVISGVDNDASLEVIERTCRERKTSLFLKGRDFKTVVEPEKKWTYHGIIGKNGTLTGLSSNLKGEHQIGNSAMALASLQVLADHGFRINETSIREGLRQVTWPGRLEHFRISMLPGHAGLAEKPVAHQYLLDGAHNPAGVMSLRRALDTDFSYENLVVIWGSMADKDILTNLSIIAPLCRTIILTKPRGERSAEPSLLREALPVQYQKHSLCIPSVAEALHKARMLAGVEDLICIAGSLYLVGEVRALLLGELA